MANVKISQLEEMSELEHSYDLVLDNGIETKKFSLGKMMKVIKITDLATTLGDVKDIVDEVNENGEHVQFDFANLGTRMYLCTITFDDSNCKVVDLVTGRIAETSYDEDKLLNVVLANASEIATQKQIDYLQTEIDELGGGEGEVGDEILFQNAQTVSCTTLSGLSVICNDVDKFVNGVGEAENNASYLLVYDGTNWEYNEQPIDIADFGISVSGTIPTGEVMTCVVSTTNVPHKIVSINQTGTNATVPSNVNEANFKMVEATYCGTTSYVFDEPESAICVTEGYTLPAGKYYVYNVPEATGDYWCNYKRLYYCFEILHDIIATAQTGDIQLRYSSRGSRETTGDARGVYQLYTKPTKCIDDSLYNSDTILFEGQIAQPSSEYTDIRTIDNFTTVQTMDSEGIIYNNLGHVCYGNPEFNVSNIRQRLNSSAKAMQPIRLHKNDIVTSLKNVKGHMYGLDPRVKAKILTAKKYLEHAVSDEFTRASLYSFDVDCFLLSMKEMSFSIQTDEGLATQLYSIYTENTLTNNAIASRGKSDKAGQSPSNYRWSASSHASYSSYARIVSATGTSDNNGASNGHRFAPAYLLKS